MSDFSIVEYFAEHEGYRCGYCKSEDTNFSHGMWAHTMTVQCYQNLIDRGWRRSGRYCYKPTMKITCCPQYTVRCAALNFKLSKSQKKVLKRMNKFLSSGRSKESMRSQEFTSLEEEGCISYPSAAKIEKVASLAESHTDEICVEKEYIGRKNSRIVNSTATLISKGNENLTDKTKICEKEFTEELVSNSNSPFKIGSGQDPDKPPCKKAKIYRKERKIQKLFEKAQLEGRAVTNVEELLHASRKQKNVPKSLEDFLAESLSELPAHKLELRLVPSTLCCRDFEQTFEESYSIYQKYQIAIHNDPPEKCSKIQYTRFLVDSPLQAVENEKGPHKGYGSFHQQYWLDDHLIAVGVLDILPQCVSSVYFYYDPDYSFLSLGTYAALREINVTRSLHQSSSQLQYYYMGFYIHSCQKMKYKGQFFPSYLLCPETYTWHPIDKCCPKLDASKYSRLEDDCDKSDPDGDVHTDKIMILHQRRVMPYPVYQRKLYSKDEDEVRQYANLVGEKCCCSMLLYRGSHVYKE